MRHLGYLAGASALALATAHPAAAQTSDAPPQSTTSDSADKAAAPAPDEVREIVVTGIRQSLERAAEIKRNADQVVDSIVSEDIGKFPDPTTAAALQRVPGVQVAVTQSNQIGNVKIRGLGDILTTLDGREIFSTTGRSFSLQDVPAAALARVDVIKTNTANLIEGGIAGIIDLQLHKPFDFDKPTVVLNGRGNYSVKADRLDPQLGFLATDTWSTGIGDIGALVNATWYKTHYNHPRTREGGPRSGASLGRPDVMVPIVAEGHSNHGYYERPQVNASLQWQPSDALQIYADGLYTGSRAEDEWSLSNAQFFISDETTMSDVETTDQCFTARVNQNGLNPREVVDRQGTADPGDDVQTLQPFTLNKVCNLKSATFRNAVSQQNTHSYYNKTDNYLGALGFKLDTDRVTVNGDVSYQNSHNIGEEILVATAQRIPELRYVSNQGDGLQLDTVGDNAYAQPDGLVIAQGLNQYFSRSKGDLFAAKLDSSFEIGDIMKSFDVGMRYAVRKAEFDQAVVQTPSPGGGSPSNPNAIRVVDAGLPDGFLSLLPSISGLNGGERSLVPDPGYLRSDEGRDAIRALFGAAAGDPDYQPQRHFDARETTFAAYAQVHYEVPLGSMTLDGTVGVRPTRTKRTINGFSAISIPATDDEPARTEIVPLSATTTDTDILPNASARLRFGGGLQARLAYSVAIRRPGFASLNPGLSYALAVNKNVLNSGSAGNPDLRPQKSENYDASLEYYFDKGFAAIAIYRHDLTDRVISSASAESIGGILYNISRPRNVGSARLQGVEISGQTFFDFLPGALSGFGAFGNFTYADTEVKGDDPLAGYPLQGVSKYNFNAGLLYEKYGLTARAVYTYRSRYYDGDLTGNVFLRAIDPDRADDTSYTPAVLNYVRPSGRLDFSLSYEVNDRIRLDVGGTNILGSHYYGYYNEKYLGNQYRYDDTTYTAGIRFAL
ncbi:TonB-dependent receptor [Stakelama saccharophila]|uniref:TonB-dependent receptor n=1 Tax=Stakelama saccharophila TaxID=3075605 RepID=A0ABZ0B9N9_9SPHN|nr:TonB-dependent receptor [Stakelama sp. W311]WNO53573.1 TonB-dependent receptor [Stakelama sp. W311]